MFLKELAGEWKKEGDIIIEDIAVSIKISTIEGDPYKKNKIFFFIKIFQNMFKNCFLSISNKNKFV